MGWVRIVARTLVGVTLLYVEGPAAGGGEPAVGLVKTRAMVEVGQVLKGCDGCDVAVGRRLRVLRSFRKSFRTLDTRGQVD
jgi:hypothetical protein